MAELRFREIEERGVELRELLCIHLREGKEAVFEKEIIGTVPEEYLDDCAEILESITECLGDGMSVAYSSFNSVLYVRIFDGERYVFPLPFLLCDDADLTEACRNLAGYTRRELIPLIISDIPRDELGVITDLFRFVDAACYEDDDDTFFVKVNNECDMCDELPVMELEGIRLDSFCENDDAAYAELCRNRELNKFWGYDVDVDNPDADDSYYRSVTEREFSDGVAMTFAIRVDGELAGEATLYDFDYFGSASIAVRVLPAFHGKGVGSRSLHALIEVARLLELCEVRTEIMNENVASIKMTSKYMNVENSENGKTKFTLKL